MHVKLHLVIDIDIVLGNDTDFQVLIVEILASIHLKGLFCYLTWYYVHVSAVASDRTPIHHQLGTLGIGCLFLEKSIEREGCGDGIRLFTIVSEVNLETGRLSVRYAADALFI